jgi:hypothetical protein
MSKLSVFIDSMKSKITQLESAINQAAGQAEHWANNHKTLIGMLQGTKEALDGALKVVDVIAPGSTADSDLKVLDEVVTNLEKAVQPEEHQ